MSQGPLPSLFGRFTAIFSEHKNMSGTLSSVGSMCDVLEAGLERLPGRIHPLELVVDLQGCLSTHFAVEEADIYFGTIVLEQPYLAGRIAKLIAEHSLMLAIAARVRELAEVESWTALVAPTRALVAMLQKHELDESRLLQEFLIGESGPAVEGALNRHEH